MDSQEAVQDVQEDAPLINPGAEIQDAPQQEAPIRLHDAEEPEASDEEPLERPDYYPEKFWTEEGPDVEKLAKSYAELEKAFKSGKHKAPEGDYDTTELVDRGLDLEDPTVQVYQDWAKKYGVSQKAFEELAGEVLAMSGDAEQAIEYDRAQEMAKLGANANEKISMVERLLTKAPLNNAERDAIAYSLNSADGINAFLKYHQALTNEGIPITPAVDTPQMTREDLAAAIADPRWQSDPAWRTKMEKQWMQSNN